MELYCEALSGLLGNPHLYSTIRAGQVDPKAGETLEALYDEAAQYCGDIAQWLKSYQTEDCPAGDLMRCLHWPDDPNMEKFNRTQRFSDIDAIFRREDQEALQRAA